MRPTKPPRPKFDPTKEPYLIGYARVSMADQNPQLQIDALKAAGVPENRIYFDRKSGSGVKREQFDLMLKDAREGDVIVIWKLDRLGRTVKQVLGTFEELANKGAAVRVITQPGMDTTTVMGRLIVTIMAAVAEMERDLIRERTIAGLKSARERGRTGGRTSELTDERVLELARLGTATAWKRSGLKSKTGWLKRLRAAQNRQKTKLDVTKENQMEDEAHAEQLAGYADGRSGDPLRPGATEEYKRGHAAGAKDRADAGETDAD
jgi:DNA invertase Pin-like site-specific DNA recombinase